MINLLSPHDKRELRAARRNVLLRRYTILIAFTLVVVAGVFAGGLFITYQQRIDAENNLQVDHEQTAAYQDTREQAERFENNLNIAKRILADDISYSTLLIDIAKALPGNAVLSSLTLNPQVFDTETTLEVHTVSYQAALDLKDALERSAVFSNVSIQNINQGGSDAGVENSNYPFSVTLSVSIVHPNKSGGQP